VAWSEVLTKLAWAALFFFAAPLVILAVVQVLTVLAYVFWFSGLLLRAIANWMLRRKA